MLAVSIVPIFAITTAKATSDEVLNIFSWGGNTSGQLGHGSADVGVNFTSPTQVPLPAGVEGWSYVSMRSALVLALAPDGRLFAWGSNNNGATGQGSALGNTPSPMPIPFPTGVTAWESISTGSSTAYALTPDGRLFAWGNNASGQLGLGDSGVSTDRHVPTFVPFPTGVTAWEKISAGQNSVLALTPDGRLFAWGGNGQGQLGLGDYINRTVPTELVLPIGVDEFSEIFLGRGPHVLALTPDGRLFATGHNPVGQLGLGDNNSRNIFTYVPTPAGVDGWKSASVGNSSSFALSTDGRLFATGAGADGRLGLGDTANRNILTPVSFPVGVTAWSKICAGWAHGLALTSDGRLFATGQNFWGQLGIGTAGHAYSVSSFVEVPIPIGGGARWANPNATQTSSMAIVISPATDTLSLEKRLQKPEGTPMPNVTFTFTFEAYSFNDLPAQSNVLPNIPNRTITIDNTSTSSGPVDSVITLTDSTNALAGIAFAQPGIYSYIVREQQSATGVGTSSSVIFSQAEYEMRIYVIPGAGIGQPPEIETVNMHRRIDTAGTAINPPVKVDHLRFDNIYRRATTGTQECPGALLVSKTVTGQFADTSTPFDFQVILTRTTLCPPTTTFTGRVLNDSNAQVGSNITFASGVMQTVALTHDQRLVIDEMIIGSSFLVVELPVAGFAPSVVLYVNGVLITPAPTPGAGGELSTGTRVVGAELRNSAAFTNTYIDPLPTGLNIGNVPLALPIFALLSLGVLLASKSRTEKKLENLLA